MNKELIKGSTVTLILTLLETESMYGYGLIKALEIRSHGLFCFKEGTLYPILHDLEKKGFVQSSWQTDHGRKRKYYHITHLGLHHLNHKQKEWQLFSTAMNDVLGGMES